MTRYQTLLLPGAVKMPMPSGVPSSRARMGPLRGMGSCLTVGDTCSAAKLDLLTRVMAAHRDALLDALTSGATACSKRQAAWRVTNLWKRLILPSLVLSWYKNARPASSNFLKNSSQLISSRPFSFGPKSMRRIPACPFSPVAFTVAGTPSRSSAHFLIFLWSVVVWLSLISESPQDVSHQWDVLVLQAVDASAVGAAGVLRPSNVDRLFRFRRSPPSNSQRVAGERGSVHCT